MTVLNCTNKRLSDCSGTARCAMPVEILSTVAQIYNKNSSGDEIANVNFYAVRPRKLPEFAEITQNNAITPFKVIQGHRFWYQSKAHIRFPISD